MSAAASEEFNHSRVSAELHLALERLGVLAKKVCK